MATPAIVVDDVSKMFRLYHDRNQSLKAAVMRGRRARYEEFMALEGVSLEVEQGTTYGLIGENGSGKSTLLKCMARILRPDSGRITGRTARSRPCSSWAPGSTPSCRARRTSTSTGPSWAWAPSRSTRVYDDIVEFSGLEKFIDTPVKNYSSGMYVRLGFSVAINVDPDVLLVDEVLAVGDEAVPAPLQREVRRAAGGRQDDRGGVPRAGRHAPHLRPDRLVRARPPAHDRRRPAT